MTYWGAASCDGWDEAGGISAMRHMENRSPSCPRSAAAKLREQIGQLRQPGLVNRRGGRGLPSCKE
eukprot:1152642-Rhodomonas_salina.3